MNTENEEIGVLTDHLKNLSLQIEVLVAKHHAAATAGAKLYEEVQQLRERQLLAARQLREIELHQSGMYMWENIGCGG